MEKYGDCLAGKQNIIAFHSRPPRRREDALELLHIYVCYVDAPSHHGGQYFVTFINDYSRKLWVFILKSKDQVLSYFKEFQARPKRESGQKLKVVRIDIGGKCSWQFKEYCKTQYQKSPLVERACREYESNNHGESKEHALSC